MKLIGVEFKKIDFFICFGHHHFVCLMGVDF